jgi:protein DGCR14
MTPERGTALIKRARDLELMPAPPPPKRIKRPQKVLDEETYVSSISHIIARDFFPGLLETETQQEYLDALESKDTAWIKSAATRLTYLMTPGRNRGRRGTSIQTPVAASETPRAYRGDTPLSRVSDTPMSSTTSKIQETVNTNMSLDRFQATYTSEDNESFYKLLDKQNEKRAEKYAWLWIGNKLPSKQLLKQKEVEEKLLESRGSLQDDGHERKMLAIKESDERPARPDTWNSRPDNNLMFAPNDAEDSIETVAEKAQRESRAAPRAVVYGNTRLPPPELAETPIVPPSPSLAALKDAIAGRPHRNDSESAFDGGETPRVNGYSFVDEEPEPHEYGLPTIVFEEADKTPNPFKIKEQSSREDLHHRMVDKVAQAKRNATKVGAVGRIDATPVPKFPSSPRVGMGGLTPAAQRLWSKVGGSGNVASPLKTNVRAPVSFSKSKNSKLKVAWTPK